MGRGNGRMLRQRHAAPSRTTVASSTRAGHPQVTAALRQATVGLPSDSSQWFAINPKERTFTVTDEFLQQEQQIRQAGKIMLRVMEQTPGTPYQRLQTALLAAGQNVTDDVQRMPVEHTRKAWYNGQKLAVSDSKAVTGMVQQHLRAYPDSWKASVQKDVVCGVADIYEDGAFHHSADTRQPSSLLVHPSSMNNPERLPFIVAHETMHMMEFSLPQLRRAEWVYKQRRQQAGDQEIGYASWSYGDHPHSFHEVLSTAHEELLRDMHDGKSSFAARERYQLLMGCLALVGNDTLAGA